MGVGRASKRVRYLRFIWEQDVLGFFYPVVDADKCIECGLCERVCGFNADNPILSDGEPLIYAVNNKNTEVRKKSTSGWCVLRAQRQDSFGRRGCVWRSILRQPLCTSREDGESIRIWKIPFFKICAERYGGYIFQERRTILKAAVDYCIRERPARLHHSEPICE